MVQSCENHTGKSKYRIDWAEKYTGKYAIGVISIVVDGHEKKVTVQ